MVELALLVAGLAIGGIFGFSYWVTRDDAKSTCICIDTDNCLCGGASGARSVDEWTTEEKLAELDRWVLLEATRHGA